MYMNYPVRNHPPNHLTIRHRRLITRTSSSGCTAREQDPVGGIARFKACCDRRYPGAEGGPPADDPYGEPLVLFSGDCLNPSLLSTVTRGKQVGPVLRACKVAVSVFGNHDFDFGVERLERVAEDSGSIWLLSNCDDVETGEPLAHGEWHSAGCCWSCCGLRDGVCCAQESDIM